MRYHASTDVRITKTAVLVVTLCCLANPVIVSARKPPGPPAHARSNNHHHGRHWDVQVGPYGFDYHSKHFGLHIGPVLRGYVAPIHRERIIVERAADAPEVVELPTLIKTIAPAAAYQAAAERAFRIRNYLDALRLANHALVEDPNNGKLHLFISQALFAIGEYRGAASVLYQSVELLDREQWGYVVENYRRFYTNADYVEQMKELDAYIKLHPQASYARLVRGYHYQYLGHENAARREFTRVLDLERRDELAARLLALLAGDVPVPVPTPEANVAERP